MSRDWKNENPTRKQIYVARDISEWCAAYGKYCENLDNVPFTKKAYSDFISKNYDEWKKANVSSPCDPDGYFIDELVQYYDDSDYY